ncbi:hypothetical protein HPB49_008938 [Dermacentor silvarum]|uniref:Uncharacterized protein n=1 Tax=Dermacentor silvarum TaxID=543639 RepID=A0ACB8DCA6_DERSI|nr:hypothetical protein HPB49_008938 [Dermacentor silvarum]
MFWELGVAGEVVIRLAEGLEGKIHKLYADNFFTSMALVRKLRKEGVVNAWIAWRWDKGVEHYMDQLEFRSRVAKLLMFRDEAAQSSIRRGRPSNDSSPAPIKKTVPHHVPLEMRFDGGRHFPKKANKSAVPTIFELYPSYVVPAAKRPHKDAACRDPPAPGTSSKHKAESLLPAHEDFRTSEEVTKERPSDSTQTNSNSAHRAIHYVVMMKRLRAQVAYQCSECAGS